MIRNVHFQGVSCCSASVGPELFLVLWRCVFKVIHRIRPMFRVMLIKVTVHWPALAFCTPVQWLWLKPCNQEKIYLFDKSCLVLALPFASIQIPLCKQELDSLNSCDVGTWCHHLGSWLFFLWVVCCQCRPRYTPNLRDLQLYASTSQWKGGYDIGFLFLL